MDNENIVTTSGGGKIIDVEINKEMKKSFLDYSMSVIMSRALPDVRDGFKPVHRRILYTMYENGLTPDKPYRKCADTVGSVLGRYHPHGDASVYDAMVRLAQNFSMRYPLVDGHGNFGSIDGDPPAAYRYTESRMSKIALEMLTDIDKETVEFRPNYDDRLKEPVVLPSRFPNLLVNGSMGIAVGMATNIPPHNLTEVVDGMCCLIDNPDTDLDELMEHIKGPDFPTAGIIMGRSGIRAAYGTGKGKLIVRARAEIEEGKNGRYRIVVTELPYQVNKARLIESIAEHVKEKKIEGIADINDYSSRNGMQIVIDLKKDANPQVVLNQLYTFTQMQVTFGVIMLALVDGVPKILTLKDILTQYIDYQCDIIRRRTEFDLRKAKERAHIVEALLKALDFIDEVIAILRASKSIPEGKTNLMERFGFDEIQANHIVQMRLGQLTGLEREKLDEEMATLKAKIIEYTEILGSHERVLAIVKEEALEISKKYGDERRTEIVNVSGEVDVEDLIPEETCVLTLTTMGYIKRQTVDTYKLQRRGGRGIIGLTRREEDVAETMFTCSTHDHIMLFTTKGRTYRLKGYEIPEGSRTSKGINIVNLLPLESEEKVSAMIRVAKEDESKYICMVTKKGVIKRSELEEYRNVRRKGVIAINLDEGDELAYVLLTSGEDNLLVATRQGMCIGFKETDARAIGRTGRGVKAITLKEGDEVVGMTLLREGGKILTVSEKGYGRRSLSEDYRIQTRGGLGVINYKTDRFGLVCAVREVKDDEDVILISAEGIIIRIPASEISIFSRPSKGVRVMRVGENDKVATITTAEHSDDENEVDTLPADDGEEDTTPEEEIISEKTE
ncbi:MAG TPA: DNA gyrase subunit A [Clostridiales bacterium]|jgi:DNA gyrase subunit A|nr:DNA gyrase subunit A [Clostridiales bacterium]HOJ35118.1 DNA gyrase subunit A [Clostridiales bacterium]HOL79386.1 DNA gyrase subunit A [Clostridiales bacterium]HQA05754.1 DNA gyrase subunit A [Clostridiales bacterium]